MKKVEIFLLQSAATVSVLAVAQQPAYKNKNLSTEARAKDLLGRMNLDEKVVQTQCLWIPKSQVLNDNGDFDETNGGKNVKNGLGELAGLNEMQDQIVLAIIPGKPQSSIIKFNIFL